MDASKDITIKIRLDTESFITDLNTCVAAAHNAADEIRKAFIGLNPVIVMERFCGQATYAPGGWTGPADKPWAGPVDKKADGAVQA